ncbi:MAG: FtsW/RodA/SpoVE family cell cycle protein [Candidatus Eisenbacteria bacterium]
MNFRLYQRRTDWVLLLPALLLLLLGLVTVYSATHVAAGGAGLYFQRHLIYVGLGLAVFVFFFVLPLRLWEDWAYLVYGAALLLLVLVLLVGDASHGSKRWFVVGPLRFQPSEFAKLALLAALARYLGNKRVDLSRAGSVLIAFGLVALPMALVLRQPDLSTAAAFPALALPMLFFAGLSRMLLFVMLSRSWGCCCSNITCSGPCSSSFPRCSSCERGCRGWCSDSSSSCMPDSIGGAARDRAAGAVPAGPHPYLLRPRSGPSGTGWQVLQSRIAIGSGQTLGKGYLQGSQKALAFLPMQHNDFIFSVVGEEWGFIGAGLVVLLFLAFVLRAVQVATVCRSPFASLLLLGGGGLIFYHAAVNIAMTMGLFPVTGLPLPLLSYGGSFLLTVMAMIGQMGNAAVHRFDH